MKQTGFGFGGLSGKGRDYLSDLDWEVAEELSPDPFSEERHTPIHAHRHRSGSRSQKTKNKENSQNQEKSQDNLI